MLEVLHDEIRRTALIWGIRLAFRHLLQAEDGRMIARSLFYPKVMGPLLYPPGQVVYC